MILTVNAELALDTKSDLGEGSIWDPKKQILYWVDSYANTLHVYDPAAKTDRTINVGMTIGCVVPRKKGGVMLALKRGFHALDLETGKLTLIADPEKDRGAIFNDGKCDPAGRFLAGTLFPDSNKLGAVYCLDTDGRVRRMIEGTQCSNGMVWSLEHKTMYYIDSPLCEISAFDYDLSTGQVKNRRTAFKTPRELGVPDGMTIDHEGKLWVAHWGGWSVGQWDPLTGELLMQVKVGASQASSCAFGGPDLDTLYITSARRGISADGLVKQPQAGGIFRCKPGARGVPAYEYGG